MARKCTSCKSQECTFWGTHSTMNNFRRYPPFTFVYYNMQSWTKPRAFFSCLSATIVSHPRRTLFPRQVSDDTFPSSIIEYCLALFEAPRRRNVACFALRQEAQCPFRSESPASSARLWHHAPPPPRTASFPVASPFSP